MKILEEQLGDLISLQDDATHLNENNGHILDLRHKQYQRDQLRREIVSKIDALVKAAQAASARLRQIDADAEDWWGDTYIRRPLDNFIDECLSDLSGQLITDLDAALAPFQEEHDDETLMR